MSDEASEFQAAPQTFEAAILKLKHISKLLESGSVPLEQMEIYYNEAMEAAEFCQKKLDSISGRLKILSKKNNEFKIENGGF